MKHAADEKGKRSLFIVGTDHFRPAGEFFRGAGDKNSEWKIQENSEYANRSVPEEHSTRTFPNFLS